LFVDRATSLLPGFVVNQESAPLIASICRRLDGIPLAIELAAARVRTLSLAQIDSRLDDRFHLLTVGERTAVPRQQSIQATLDWSYALLSESGRMVLCRLTVFAGGWTLEAAESVCAADPLAAGEILDLLSALVDQSLVLKEEREGQARFRMLETIRQYASEKWNDSTDSAAIRWRHLEFFLRLAADAEPQLKGAGQVDWLNRLELEHDNLRAALAWSKQSPGLNESGLRLAGALGIFWDVRGLFSEGRAQLASVLSGQLASEPTAARAKALYMAGCMAYSQGDYPATCAVLEESLAICHALGPAGRRGLADALIKLGDMQTEVGDYATAFALMSDALSSMRELQDVRGTAKALWQLGYCASRSGDYEQAVRHFAEALPLTRQLGDKQDTAIILTGLAELALRQGDYARATSLEAESLQLRRTLGEKWGIAASLGNLAWIALHRTDLTRAARLLRVSLRLRRELGDRGGIAWCLEKMAELALIRAQRESDSHSAGDWRRAVRLFGAAESVRARFGSAVDRVDRQAHEQQLGSLRAHFDAVAFGALWAEAQAMSLEQAVASALGDSAQQPAILER
jgi:non-specific serine/threonine protein kinase